VLGRPAPAPRHRARRDPPAARLPVRRQLLRAGLRDRRPPARGAAAADPRCDGDRRRAAGGDHPGRRADPRARPRPHRRPRDARRAAGRQPDVPGDRDVPDEPGGGGVSEQKSDQKTAQAPARGRGPGGGGPMGMGMPVQKPLDFRGSLRRFAGTLRPERFNVFVVLVLGIGAVALTVLGPKLLGNATNVIFAGVVGSQLPAGVSVEQAEEGLRAQGQDRMADLLSGVPGVVPGQGVDFTLLMQTLGWVVAAYLGAFLFGWLQARITTGVVQRTMRSLRDQVEAKLHRIPLSYVDAQQRGEILSRVTNDIDNVAQTTTQTLAQLVTALLTVVGVLFMMFWISPLLAVVALV